MLANVRAGVQGSRNDKNSLKLLSATWCGEKRPMLSTTLQPRDYSKVSGRAEIEKSHLNIEKSSLPFSSHSIKPIKRIINLPAAVAKTTRHMEVSHNGFIPVRAIQVTNTRKMQVKDNDDFRNMKNLFLANCLRLKDGELGFSE